MIAQVQSLAGLVGIPLIAWLLSEGRAQLSAGRLARIMTGGLALQLGIAGLMLNVPAARAIFDAMGGIVAGLQNATTQGVQLVFGFLAGGPAPYDITNPAAAFTLGFQALPLILVISALSRLFYHWGVLQRVVAGFAWLFQRSVGVSGPVGTAAAANVFVGMIESPLLIKPYLAGMSRSGLYAMMSVGMAGIAGTVLAVYASILGPHVPGAAGHLIVASVISAPAALMLAQIMIPEREDAVQPKSAALIGRDTASSSMDAIAQGTREGIDLFANVVAMLIVAVALVALANMLLGFALKPFGVSLTFQQLLGYLFAPLAWLTGIPAGECLAAGGLLGIKTVLNEFVAYLQLAAAEPAAFSERTRLILTYALCGFANFGSMGILIGALSSMAPERRAEIAGLGWRTIISGTLATLMTAAIVGLMTPG